MKKNQSLKDLLEQLKDENCQTRALAAKNLSSKGLDAIDILVKTLEDESDLVKRAAAESLGWMRYNRNFLYYKKITSFIAVLEELDKKELDSVRLSLANYREENNLDHSDLQTKTMWEEFANLLTNTNLGINTAVVFTSGAKGIDISITRGCHIGMTIYETEELVREIQTEIFEIAKEITKELNIFSIDSFSVDNRSDCYVNFRFKIRENGLDVWEDFAQKLRDLNDTILSVTLESSAEGRLLEIVIDKKSNITPWKIIEMIEEISEEVIVTSKTETKILDDDVLETIKITISEKEN